MKKCCEECIPMCDFCAYAKHGDFDIDGTTGPVGCKKHPDKEHQDIALDDYWCEDFTCFRISRSVEVEL